MNNTIRPLASGDYPEFFNYLNAQLKENGKHGFPLFQPVSRDVVNFPEEKESMFIRGLSRDIGSPGWRRAWVICNDEGMIMGHMDLRGHVEAGITHRALLGMGVSRDFRRNGLAKILLGFASQWVKEHEQLEWIDIEVLTANAPAAELYRRAGFEELCVIRDMFRIDGQSEDVIRMTLRIQG